MNFSTNLEEHFPALLGVFIVSIAVVTGAATMLGVTPARPAGWQCNFIWGCNPPWDKLWQMLKFTALLLTAAWLIVYGGYRMGETNDT